MRKDVPKCEKAFLKYRADIQTLQQQLKDCFQDFHTMQPRIALFMDPLSATVSEQPPELQLELCELQSDPFFQAKRSERGISIWRILPESRFPLLRDGQHVWEHLHLREQLLNNEAHQVKREKQADRWNSVPAQVDWCKYWHWHSDASRTGHKYLIKTEHNTDPLVGEVYEKMWSAWWFETCRMGVEMHYKHVYQLLHLMLVFTFVPLLNDESPLHWKYCFSLRNVDILFLC